MSELSAKTRYLSVLLPDGRMLFLDYLPEELTTEILMRYFLQIQIIKELAPFSLKCNGKILKPTDLITSKDIEIVNFKPKKFIYGRYFIFILSLIGFIFYSIKSGVYDFSINDGSLLGSNPLLLLISSLFLLLSALAIPVVSYRPSGLFVEILHLFIKSLTPGFQLEDVLINDNH